jgi:hypothetical protein
VHLKAVYRPLHLLTGLAGAQFSILLLRMIGAEIYTSDYHKSGNLFFEAPGRGYGFPVQQPCAIR